MARTTNAIGILRELTGKDEATLSRIARIHLDFDVAQLIYDARMRAGLSQTALAEMIGTKQSVIARLEDADYQGHSLTMLQRIARALNQRLEVRFVGQTRKPRGRNQKAV